VKEFLIFESKKVSWEGELEASGPDFAHRVIAQFQIVTGFAKADP
jgi:hypothetical protein